jgi:subtilisin
MKLLSFYAVMPVLILMAAVSTSLAGVPSGQAVIRGKVSKDLIPGRYIVVLKEGARSVTVAKRHGCDPDVVYDSAFNGFAGTIAETRVRGLLLDADVAWVEQDQRVSVTAQTVPVGIRRVGADLNPTVVAAYLAKMGVNVDIAIIDTGIQLNHPELNVVKNVSFIRGIRSGDDDNGHGTHCAGIAAARDNAAGVVGVAPGARLWAVKVLDRSGSGSMSGVIKGVDYVTSNAASIEVANMSLGGGNSDTLKLAIAKAAAKGVVFAVAAGNNGADASSSSPANSPDVLSVSAIVDTDGLPGGLGGFSGYGADDAFASFSNYGSVVNSAAPGVAILSTFINGGYATMSGTSMAAPHVAGAAALYLATRVKPTSAAGAASVRQAIITASRAYSAVPIPGDKDSVAEPVLYAEKL